jgi:hypothetical protein
MSASDLHTENIALTRWIWLDQTAETKLSSTTATPLVRPAQPRTDVLKPVRLWLDNIEVRSPKFARSICKLVPAQCPFERDVKAFGRILFHIPPMCKLNPLYEQVVALRFRALCYLADDCGEDISPYC